MTTTDHLLGVIRAIELNVDGLGTKGLENAGTPDAYVVATVGRQDYARLIASAPTLAAENDRLRAINADLVGALTLAEEEGHYKYCAAIKGPDGENWLEPEHCNCSMKAITAALAKSRTESGT